MLVKKKICIACNTLQYLFARKMCQQCASKNPKPKSLLKEPVKKPLYKPTGELILFQSIWASRPHVCTICDKKLHEFNVGFFSHVLSKAAFPRFRLLDRNIVIKCLDCHSLYGTKTNEYLLKLNPSRWSAIIQKHDELLQEYYRSRA
jgi:hypothetical protein